MINNNQPIALKDRYPFVDINIKTIILRDYTPTFHTITINETCTFIVHVGIMNLIPRCNVRIWYSLPEKNYYHCSIEHFEIITPKNITDV